METNFDNKLEINREKFSERFKTITNNEQNKQIAEKIYTSESKISKLLNSKADPTLTDLLNISSVYGCSIDFLLNMSEDPFINNKTDMSIETNTTLSNFISCLFKACENEEFSISCDSPFCASINFSNPEIVSFLQEWKTLLEIKSKSDSGSRAYTTWKSGILNDSKEQLKKYDYKPRRQIADETIATLEEELASYQFLLGSDYEPTQPHSDISLDEASIMYSVYPNNKHIRELYDFWLSSDAMELLPFE